MEKDLKVIEPEAASEELDMIDAEAKKQKVTDVKRMDANGYRFLEFFAGSGVLTQAVERAGVPVDPPDELADGGTNFGNDWEVEVVKNYLAELASSGVILMLHVAPPCATFSRARDRSWKTRLRSTARPQGLRGLGWWCREANRVARNTLNLVEYCVKSLGAMASMDNPSTSYLWSFLEFDEEVEFNDVVFSPCRFGAEYRKPTRLRCWGWRPDVLDALCTRTLGRNSCGRDQHTVLEFGSASTAQAAAYHEEVCRWWAMEVREALLARPSVREVVDSATKHSHGRVLRHLLRGAEAQSTKERRDSEDRKCTAGMRNPYDVVCQDEGLQKVGRLLREYFVYIRDLKPEKFANLTECCGAAPGRQPPDEEDLRVVRVGLEKLFQVEDEAFEAHHPASSWRYELVKAIQKESGDPDEVLPGWLASGAPMGISRPIETGGHFPKADPEAGLTVEDL